MASVPLTDPFSSSQDEKKEVKKEKSKVESDAALSHVRTEYKEEKMPTREIQALPSPSASSSSRKIGGVSDWLFGLCGPEVQLGSSHSWKFHTPYGHMSADPTLAAELEMKWNAGVDVWEDCTGSERLQISYIRAPSAVYQAVMCSTSSSSDPRVFKRIATHEDLRSRCFWTANRSARGALQACKLPDPYTPLSDADIKARASFIADHVCSICQEALGSNLVGLSGCVHILHASCAAALCAQEKKGVRCPECKSLCDIPLGIRIGNCPQGVMRVEYSDLPLPGFHDMGRIEMTVHIPPGMQDCRHPHPANSFSSNMFPRTIYLPAAKSSGPFSAEAKRWAQIAKRIWTAFYLCLLFTIDNSRSTAEKDTVCWNPNFRLRTTTTPDVPFGFTTHRDTTYYDHIDSDLNQYGITNEFANELWRNAKVI